MTELRRGGFAIKTKIGNIQLGFPPETVKDSINQKLAVPTYYIVPACRFDKKYCTIIKIIIILNVNFNLLIIFRHKCF